MCVKMVIQFWMLWSDIVRFMLFSIIFLTFETYSLWQWHGQTYKYILSINLYFKGTTWSSYQSKRLQTSLPLGYRTITTTELQYFTCVGNSQPQAACHWSRQEDSSFLFLFLSALRESCQCIRTEQTLMVELQRLSGKRERLVRHLENDIWDIKHTQLLTLLGVEMGFNWIRHWTGKKEDNLSIFFLNLKNLEIIKDVFFLDNNLVKEWF